MNTRGHAAFDLKTSRITAVCLSGQDSILVVVEHNTIEYTGNSAHLMQTSRTNRRAGWILGLKLGRKTKGQEGYSLVWTAGDRKDAPSEGMRNRDLVHIH